MGRSLTDINEAVSDCGYEHLSDNTKAVYKSRFRCAHGHEWEAPLRYVLSLGRGCPECSLRGALSLEETQARLLPLGFAVVSGYTQASRKCLIRCKNGHEWVTKPTALFAGRGCPECSPRRPLYLHEVQERLRDRGLEVVSGYISAGKKCLIRCSHGHEWMAKPELLFAGRGCPVCSGVAKWTVESVIRRLESKGITLVGPFCGTNARTQFRCNCGHEWDAYMGSVLHVSGCPKCAKYGFDATVPAHFYVLKLTSRNGEYVGFGITKDIDTRLRAHSRELSKQGFNVVQVETYFFSRGSDARVVEELVGEHLGGIDLGVSGFRREALMGSDYDKLMGIITSCV